MPTLQDKVNAALRHAFDNEFEEELKRQTYDEVAVDLISYDADLQDEDLEDVENCVYAFFQALR